MSPSRDAERAIVINTIVDRCMSSVAGTEERIRRRVFAARVLDAISAAGFAVVPREARVSMCLAGKIAFDEATAALTVHEGPSMAMRPAWDAMVRRADLASPPPQEPLAADLARPIPADVDPTREETHNA